MSPELRDPLGARLQEWLRSDDPVERAHAAWRLAQPDMLRRTEDGATPRAGPTPERWGVPPMAEENPSSVLTLPSSVLPLIPLTESLGLLRLVKLCRYRSTTSCGCSGARCGLRSAIVSHRDCLDCVRSYGTA